MGYALVLPAAYLLGSISWGLLVGKLARGIDLRQYGSGATGATNVLRALGPRLAGLVMVADISKGVIAVLLARLVTHDAVAESLAGILVVVGHNWPVFSRFQGGRGTTTGVGGLAVISPLAAAVALAVFVFTVVASRYASLGSVLAVLTAMIALPVLIVIGPEPSEYPYLIYVAIGCPLILWRHRGNIQRLAQGKEPRISLGRTSDSHDGGTAEGGR
ncbi:MAG: glycerol-3-phosphate 1-O-acyltransferase PlsY [Chloroflexi bacterium]|nr:glycerol-3-phosphate 1-O-acyltransferase PlsY [Chloroflexota bacterium]